MEHKRKCNVCGKIYCFTDEDLQNNAKNAGISALEALGGLASSLGGGTIFHTQYLQGQSDRYADKVVDYDQCPYCHSRDVSVYIGEVKTPAPAIPEPVAAKRLIDSGASTEALLKRAYIFLEDEDWEAADAYCEACLDRDPELARAYLGKLLAELELTGPDMLSTCSEPFDESKNYKKALRYADDGLRNQLTDILEQIRTNNENSRKDALLSHAREIMERGDSSADYQEALGLLQTIPGWKDADTLAKLCQGKLAGAMAREQAEAEAARLQEEARRIQAERDAEIARKEAEIAAAKTKKIGMISAIAVAILVVIVVAANAISGMVKENNAYKNALALMDAGQYEEAIAAFEAMDGYKDSAAQIEVCYGAITDRDYNTAVELMNAGQYEEAIAVFQTTEGYKDSAAQSKICHYSAAEEALANGDITHAAMHFGAADYSDSKARSMELWDKIAVRETISAGQTHTVALKSDGTVVAVGDNEDGQCDVSGWTNIVAISAGGDSTVGLKSDGTVVAVGSNKYGQCDVSGWTDIVAIFAGLSHTVGLKADGTLVDTSGRVPYETDIVAISSSSSLKSDGTLTIAKNYSDIKENVYWTDIVAFSYKYFHAVGLKSDGTVVAVGDNDYGQCDVSDWTDIVAIAAGDNYTVGLKSDETVVTKGYWLDSRRKVSDWTDIVAISASTHTVGLKSDGTVVATGYNYDGQCNVFGWTDIKQP